jgi:hypothetical protein
MAAAISADKEIMERMYIVIPSRGELKIFSGINKYLKAKNAK